MAFRHIRCVGAKVYATVCDQCRTPIAWSPKPEFLRIAEFVHEPRHALAVAPATAIVTQDEDE